MYWKDIWKFRSSIEYEFKYAGKYGAKGEKRADKVKATPEQIKKQNQTNRENKVRRLIKENFREHDLWCTLKYPRGTRLSIEQVLKDIDDFLRACRGAYKKNGAVFKYIKRLEIGARGGIHLHILVNRIAGVDTDKLLQKLWGHGRINYETLYESGGYADLAEYLVKQPTEEIEGQLSMFAENERKKLVSYSTSKNLVRPQPERKEYRRWTLKDLVENGPKPTPGYYIDKNSIVWGVNRYTGMGYYRYTEYKIKKDEPEEWQEGEQEDEFEKCTKK